MDIEQRTRRSLEWERLKGYLAAEACCQWSSELCLQLAVLRERQLIEALLDETSEALAMLAAGFGLSQDGLPELRECLGRCRAGAQLAPKELLDLKKMVLEARSTRTQLKSLATSEFPRLSNFVDHLIVQDDLVAAVDNVFDEIGNVKDTASSLLHQLRKDVSRLNNRAKDELLRIINASSTSKALQEPIYTTRNGRYVVPVQASLRHAVAGIVHDSSASGMTVYVEPMAVVEITNQARLKEAEIEREIDRLLSELSALAQKNIEDLDGSYRSLVEIDFIAARARLAQKYDGIRPQLGGNGHLNLRAARHPLLVLQNQAKKSEVVPDDIVLGGDVRTLVITGPNTGGKTVYLKTAGLLSLMLRTGLLLPVQSGSVASIFEKIYADIGDEQSLEQSLSTFSSHMANIIEVVARSGESTLVLLDEIGAGTDPKEGAILARVILEHLNQSKALTISTTHLGEMKMLAYTSSGFINGSLDFDETTLSPTYHMRLGVPGSSKAITIASRLGLDRSLIERAAALASEGGGDVQQLIEQLESKLKAALEKERLADELLQKARQQENTLTEEREKLKIERESMRRGLADQMEQELSAARDLTRLMIAQLQKQPSIQKAQKTQEELEKLRNELGWLKKEEYEQNQELLRVGQSVRVLSLNQRGIVEELSADPKVEVSVRAGRMKIKVPRSDLEIVASAPPSQGQLSKPAAQSQRSRSKAEERLDVFVRSQSNTLDLRGQRVDEAMANLERFIDSAFLAHQSPVMVVHGHGTGRVRSAVRDYLATCAYDVRFRAGETYEGGDGVTVVQFG